MTQTATMPAERAHRAAKRYIYAFGGGRAEGDATMRDLLGGKGAGLAEMTNAGLPVPPGLHDHDRGLQRLLRRTARSCPTACGTTSWPRCTTSRAETGKGFGDAGQPAARQRALGRQVLDARHDGHGPQPGPQRGDAAGPDRADRQRALRLGRLPPLHPDVRPHRHGRRPASTSTHALDAAKERAASKQDTDLDAAALRELVGAFKAIVREVDRPRVPDGPAGAARPGDQGRLRLVVRQARPRLPRRTTRSRTTWARRSTS